jgi:CRP-like cAMP-binding protein
MTDQLQLTFVRFLKNAYIVVEGKRNADRFFLIRAGKVRLSKEVQVVTEERGDILGPGDFFGVVSTMSGRSHIETAQALTDVVLIPVQRDQYSQLIQNNSPVATKILLQFSRRMRYLNEALTRLTLKKNAEVGADHLYNVAEYYAKLNQFNLAYYAYHQYIRHCPGGKNVPAAKERLKKIASYVRGVKLDFKPDELLRSYPKETMIFSEGEPGEEIFIIKQGSVKIVKVVDNNEVLLAVLKTGDVFGEMALLESKPRGASAVAYEECQLMVVNRANFDYMIKTQPQLIARLTTMLAERLWLIYKQLGNTQINDLLGRMYDMLLIHLEQKQIDLKIKRPYQFDFGTKELINMVGLASGDGSVVLQKLLQSRSIEIVHNKICVVNVLEFTRQATYYRTMQEKEARRARS